MSLKKDSGVLKPWEILFDRMIGILETLPFHLREKEEWVFGGGTALRLYYDHRESNDIDIFIKNPALIPYLSPRVNDRTESMSHSYTEMSNFLKLHFSEGEIDFIVSPTVTDYPSRKTEIRGNIFLIESPDEIISKKILYRSDEFKPRDVFDTVVALRHDSEILLKNRNVLRSRFPVLLKRLSILEKAYSGDNSGIRYMKAYSDIIPEMYLSLTAAINSML
ncbi:MAG: nucleotidyl transferase AbiEii/AbiGii toxin family protein [Leptospirales bacterium]